MYSNEGRFLVRAIFWELSDSERRLQYPPLYTLKVEDAHGLPSAYRIYMNSIDEYDAAIKLVGNMKNWRQLENASWFMNGIPEMGHEGLKQWRKDMEARDKSIAKAQLQDKALEGNVAAMTKLYNISPKKADGRLKKDNKKGKTTDSLTKVVDIAKNLK